MKTIKYHAVAALFGATLFASQSYANLIVNGDFGTLTLSGWTQNGNVGGDAAVFVVSGAGGAPGAQLGSIGTLDYLSQTFATQIGATYQVQFDFRGDHSSPSEFDALFGPPTVLPNSAGLTTYGGLTDLLTLGGPLHNETLDLSAQAGVFFAYDFDVEATSSTSELTFASREDKTFDDLGQVSVTLEAPVVTVPVVTGGTSAVPEPSTYGLIGATALFSVAALRRRRAKSVAGQSA